MNYAIRRAKRTNGSNLSLCREVTRRLSVFIGAATLAAMTVNAAAADMGGAGEDQERYAWIERLKNWNSNIKPTRIVSWNAYSRQFIDAPTFRLVRIPKAAKYVAEVKQGKQIWKVESETPLVSLEKIWPKMDKKLFSLEFRWLDKAGDCLSSETSIRVKAPDFPGLKEPDADWRATADRNMEFFIHTAWNGKAPYREPDVPVWIWSAASPTVVPKSELGDYPDGYPMGYPCITLNYYIFGLLAYVDRGGAQKDEAMRLARICGDWGLKHRLPDSGKLPLFPFSTITKGQFTGGNEGANVTLLRAPLLALGYVDLYAATKHQPYLDYAIHIAKTTAKFQVEDGSFPYRLNPETGAISEYFTPAAADFAALVRALEPYYQDPDLSAAAEHAVSWVISDICTSNHWKGVFEDVFPWPPFSNLSSFELELFIQFLCRYHEDDPSFLPLARRLTRFLEDQFVIFSSESEAFVHQTKGIVHVKGPLAFEQFVCWFPMEAHAGHYLRTLIALHKATGDPIYLEKARATGNAICALQFEDGQFSTLGARYYQDGKIVSDKETGYNWYNANVAASMALYALDAYVKPTTQRK